MDENENESGGCSPIVMFGVLAPMLLVAILLIIIISTVVIAAVAA